MARDRGCRARVAWAGVRWSGGGVGSFRERVVGFKVRVGGAVGGYCCGVEVVVECLIIMIVCGSVSKQASSLMLHYNVYHCQGLLAAVAREDPGHQHNHRSTPPLRHVIEYGSPLTTSH